MQSSLRFLSNFSRTLVECAQPLLPVFLLLLIIIPAAQARNYGSLSEDPRSLREVAFEHYIDNDPNTALDFYQKAVDRAIKDYGADSTFVGDLYFEMGVLAFDAGWFQKAETYLTKAVQQNPNSIVAKVKLAELLEVRDRPDLALNQIQSALAKKRNSSEARQALVMWLIKQRNAAGAVRESYVLSQQMQKGVPLPPDSHYGNQTTAVASAQIPQPAPAATAAVVAPAKPPVPPGNDIKSMMNQLFQGGKPKPAEPAKKQPELKIKPQEKAKPVEKHENKKRTETKKAKPEKHLEKKITVPVVPAVPNVEEPEQGEKAHQDVLTTSAKRVGEPKKHDTEKAKPTPSENETRQQPRVEQQQPVEVRQNPVMPPPPVVYMPPPSGKKPKSGGLVPPPPPMVPNFPVYPGPPPMMPPPVQRPVAHKQPPKEKPVEKAQPADNPPSETHSEHASGGGSTEEPDFLLDWGNVNKKKKGPK